MYRTVDYSMGELTDKGYEKCIFPQSVVWYLNGERHRKDGPADIRYETGTKIIGIEYWFLNGEPHREDGPADIYYKNGKVLEEEKEWHLNGSELFKKDFTTIEMINSMKAWSLFTPVELIRLKNQ